MNKYYRSLVLADGQDGQPHVELRRGIGWGQSSHLAAIAHQDDLSDVMGGLEPGDRVKFIFGAPPAHPRLKIGDPIRVLVQTHDGRRVGHSGNAVWIVWPGVKEARRIFRIVKGER